MFAPTLVFLLLISVKRSTWSLSVLLGPSILYIFIVSILKVTSISILTVFYSYKMIKAVILFYSIASVILFSTYIVEKISETKADSGETLIKIGIVGIAGILFFSIIFTSVYHIFPDSFEGYVGDTLMTRLISFFYFSVISFMSVGYGDISPSDNLSRILVSIEVLFGFFTVIYGLSCLSFFRESFNKKGVHNYINYIKKHSQ